MKVCDRCGDKKIVKCSGGGYRFYSGLRKFYFCKQCNKDFYHLIESWFREERDRRLHIQQAEFPPEFVEFEGKTFAEIDASATTELFSIIKDKEINMRIRSAIWILYKLIQLKGRSK